MYYQTKIIPLIQIRAQDMRQYYQAHIGSFQKQSAAKFRVIWISSDATGSRDAALKKATEVYERAKAGEDFAELAGERFNDDQSYKANKGVPPSKDANGWMEKAEFASDQVDEAVWKLQPGQVAGPIHAPHNGRDGYWIVKLDDIRLGRTEPFEDPKVQDVIRSVLRREQFVKLREAQQQALLRDAVVLPTPGADEVMMEMVMQRYRLWTRGK